MFIFSQLEEALSSNSEPTSDTKLRRDMLQIGWWKPVERKRKERKDRERELGFAWKAATDEISVQSNHKSQEDLLLPTKSSGTTAGETHQLTGRESGESKFEGKTIGRKKRETASLN